MSLLHIDMRLYPCRCCGAATMTAQLGERLRTLNEALERRGICVRVNSGYRCEAHNAKVGGVSRSRHMTGEAVDLAPMFPEGVRPSALAALIEDALGVDGDYQGGIGIYKTFVHMDIGKRSRWRGCC